MPREARLDRISVKRRGYLPPGSAPRKSLPASAPPRQHRPHYTFLETSGWSTVEDGASVPPEQAPSAQAEPQGEILCVRSPEAGIPFTEAYGTLLTNLAHTRSGQQLGTILFTSALPGDGKTTSAVNFCLTLPDRSHRVLLIDADLRRGIIHKIFGGRRTPGLMEVLSGKLELERACRMVQVGDSGPMWYLPTGSPPTQPAGLMSSAEMRAVIERASEQFDLVIIDSPPVNIVTDAVLLSTHIDGVVLVARAGATDKAALGYAAERLRRVGARVCGIMLNDIDPRRDAVYDRAYKYVAYTQYTSAAD
jgi:capsular exopolysaccharide synthesis family protein